MLPFNNNFVQLHDYSHKDEEFSHIELLVAPRGGGVLDPYLGIGEPLRVETLTLFRTKKILKYIPCLGHAIPRLQLGQTCAKLYTLLRTDSHEITYPEPKNHTTRP